VLKNVKLPIEDIALNVGFSIGNYFGKVIRSSLRISPGEYRNTKSFITADHIIGDYLLLTCLETQGVENEIQLRY